MAKEKNIHIRIELGKDKTSGNLTLLTYFDQNAPNFAKDEEGYYWLPTVEEKNFLNEAFELIPTSDRKTPLSTPKKTVTSPPELPKEPPKIEEKKPKPTTSEKPTTDTLEIEEKPMTPFDQKEKGEDEPAEFEHFSKSETEDEPGFEVTDDKPETNEQKDKKEEEKKILVEADDQAIEDALKKEEETDETMIEVDEQTIIDKVLSQKKKGKWSRGR